MSSEAPNLNADVPQTEGAGEDLTAALGTGGDTEFIATEEKKPVVSQGMLYLLVLVALGGGGTYYMYQKQGPAAANAATASAESAHAQETINTFLASGPNGMKTMETMLKDTENIVKQFNDYPSVTQVPLSALQKNPFRFAAKTEDGKPAKPDEEDVQKKREEERASGLRASQALNLQSIIHSGTRKACMINNTLYSEGQQVEQFTIEKITPNSVILRTNLYRYERKMQQQ